MGVGKAQRAGNFSSLIIHSEPLLHERGVINAEHEFAIQCKHFSLIADSLEEKESLIFN